MDPDHTVGCEPGLRNRRERRDDRGPIRRHRDTEIVLSMPGFGVTLDPEFRCLHLLPDEEISVADIGPDIVFRLEAGSGCGDAEDFVEGGGL
jgi:hypothetical protein